MNQSQPITMIEVERLTPALVEAGANEDLHDAPASDGEGYLVEVLF